MSLPALAIRRPVATAMLLLAILLIGAISVRRLPVDLLPEVAYPRLVVQTTAAGSAPAEVERFLSEPIEQALSGVPGVLEVESVSREAVSSVTVRFAWGTDIDFATLNVREKLDGISERLPERAGRPVVLRLDPKSEPVMTFSVSGDAELPRIEELAAQVFRRRLEQLDGVARVAITGGFTRQIDVALNPERMAAFGLTLRDVGAALEAANVAAPGGTIRQGQYRYSLRILGELEDVGQIARTPIGGSGAAAGLLLRDIATVTDGWQERESIARYNGRESVGMLLFKDADANTVRVAEAVERTVGELRERYPEVRLEVATSQAEFVSEAIDNVLGNLVQGALLAFLVLVLFLRDVRYPVAIGLVIPVSIIGAFILMDLFGVTLNVMSLGGLALGVGMLVDNSIVVLENIFRHREMGLDATEAALAGTEEVKGAITAATLTTIAVFGPIIYIRGVSGELFGALSLAVAFSLLASLLVALTLLPAVAAQFGAASPRERGAPGPLRAAITRGVARPLRAFDRAFARFEAGYERALAAALSHRRQVLAGSAVLVCVAAAAAMRLERRFLPEVDQGEFRVRIALARGTPLERTAALAGRAEGVFLADSSVGAVFTRVGRREAVAGGDPDESGLHTAVLDVRLKKGESAGRVIERLRPRLGFLARGSWTVEAGDATAVGRLLGGGDADLAIRVRGEDLNAALAYATRLQPALATVPSLVNVRAVTRFGQPEMRAEIDRERAASHGISPREVADAIGGYMHGDVVTELVDFDRKVPVIVRLPEAERGSLAALDVVQLRGVPLRELVRIRPTVGPTAIERQGQRRVVTLDADVGEAGLEPALREVREVLRRNPPPAGLQVEVGGENEEMRRGYGALGAAFGMALLLVFMILAAEFESLLLPMVVLTSVPMGLVGAFLALWVSGEGLNTMSLIGIVVLAGIVDNDAVMKVNFITRLRREGLAAREAIVAAGQARLRPVLMTTLTTLLGLLPMTFATGRGAELRAALGVVIFGGLFTSTALTLLVLPVLYEAVDELQAKLRVRRAAPAVAEPAFVPGD